MTKQIDELMALADGYADWAEAESRQALRQALEAALKPGEPVAKYIGDCPDGSLVQLLDDLKKGTELYAAAPQHKHQWRNHDQTN